MTSPGEEVTVFTSPYLSAGATALGEAKGLKKEINLDAYFENSLKLDKADKEHIYLIKGLCKVNLNENFTDLMKKRILLYANLHNFLNPFFNAIISPKDESLLFLGKTSCKTYLCETLFMNEFEIPYSLFNCPLH